MGVGEAYPHLSRPSTIPMPTTMRGKISMHAVFPAPSPCKSSPLMKHKTKDLGKEIDLHHTC
ncbi:hypothetical protein TIFTF001_020981 [Ficus carica]|uniref:Uncharacterized protein n=1 Tax=Ficus carica TaxID=3494 RepID=A0AA88AS53_FICCA|nr:hypothetical protein TIFTF001_020981 [Ficus carica]